MSEELGFKFTMDTSDESNQTIEVVVQAVDKLPIAERLKFARTIIFRRGGDEHSIPQNAEMVIIAKILNDVITALEVQHPKAARSRTSGDDARQTRELRKVRRDIKPG